MSYIDTHAGDLRQKFVTLLRIDFGSPVYWTDHDMRVVTTGLGLASSSWTPYQFRVSGIDSEHGTVSGKVTVDVGDGDGLMGAIVLAGGILGVKVYVYVAYLDPDARNTIAQDVRQLFAGVIDTPTIDTDRATVTLALSPLIDLSAIVLPRRVLGPACSLDFKGAACQYAGSDTSCTHLIADCTTKSNSLHYGGFGMFPVYVT